MAPTPTHKKSLSTEMLLSGCVGATTVGIMNPVDTLRIRWQVRDSIGNLGNERFRGRMYSFGAHILKREGLWKGLWQPGCLANCSAICFSTGFRLGAYPTIRDTIGKSLGHKDKHPAVMWLSGLLPGLIGYWFITPLYAVKTQLQVSAAKKAVGEAVVYNSTVHGLSRLGKDGGIRSLYRGALSLMARGGLISSGQTLGYDLTKTKLKEAPFCVRDGPVLHVASSIAAGIGATAFGMPADVVFTFWTTAKQRGTSYRGIFHCLQDLVKTGGFRVFYRGSFLSFCRVVPIFTLYFPLYEQVRRLAGLGYMD